VSDETSKKHFSYWTQLITQYKLENSQNLEEREGEFQKLKCSRDERRRHPGRPFYRGVEGQLAG
jgi:hypothetical protein